MNFKEWKREKDFFREKEKFHQELPSAFNDRENFRSWIANRLSNGKRYFYGTADDTPEERKQRITRIRELMPDIRRDMAFYFGTTGVRRDEKENAMYQVYPGVYSNKGKLDNLLGGGESKLSREMWFDSTRVWLLEGLHFTSGPKIRDFKPIVWAEQNEFRNHNLLLSNGDFKQWQKCLRPLRSLVNCGLLCEKCHVYLRDKAMDHIIAQIISVGNLLDKKLSKIEFISQNEFDDEFYGKEISKEFLRRPSKKDPTSPEEYNRRRLNRQLAGLKYTPDEIKKAREKDIYAFKYGEGKLF